MRCVCFCLAVLVFPSLLRPALGSWCGPKEYPLSTSKCCKKCSPGEEMRLRCTVQDETKCEPCEPGYYSQDFNEDSSCTLCTICDPDRGLQEVKECEKTSNTVCTCLSGFSPEPGKDKQSCKPCPPGQFSKGGNDMCQLWTNCTARGRKRLRAGSREEDAVCDNPPAVSPRLTATTTVRSTLAVAAATTRRALATRAKEEPPRPQSWGFVTIVLSCAAVVLVLGSSAFCLLKSKPRKQQQQRTLEVSCRRDRKNSYRIPIQEEQVDYKSSLVRN
ncbi:hypothetical protein lerEdw1_019746 [Lerista edwardsae]|nr:hypothetical protein lerEdw1_019746 [Lerista edwardsae]